MISSITVSIPVKKRGQLCYFDVYIPSDAQTAFDPSAAVNATDITPDMLVAHNNAGAAGQIKLQSPGSRNWCYNAIVPLLTATVEVLLPGLDNLHNQVVPLLAAPYHSADYSPQAYYTIGSRILHGCYEDLIGAQLGRNTAYNVTLTIGIKY